MRTTIPAEDAPPDLIGRRFDPPDVAWVGDISYIATGKGWLYRASLLDLGSRRVLGCFMANHMSPSSSPTPSPCRRRSRRRHRRIIFHGDRGSQYLSGEYRHLVARLGMVQSVGRTELC